MGKGWDKLMNFEQEVQLSITVLFTGLVIVFVMLIALTFIIKGYGAVVNRIQNKMSGDAKSTADDSTPVLIAQKNAPKTSTSSANGAVSGEVVAAISAAVYMMYGASYEVTNIRRAARPNRSAWKAAGLLENTRPF